MGTKTRAISNFLTNASGAGFGMVFLAEYDGSGGSSHSIGPSIMTTDYESFYCVYRAANAGSGNSHYRVKFKTSGGTTINTYNIYTYDQISSGGFGRGGNAGYSGNGGNNSTHALLAVNSNPGDLVVGNLWVHNTGMAGGSATHRNRMSFNFQGQTHQQGFSSIYNENLNGSGQATADGTCAELEFSYAGGQNIDYNIKIYGLKK